jgi:PAS domain-containing protein
MRENAQRWVFGGVAVVYTALVLALLPSASDWGYDAPYLIAIFGIAICAADLCTVLFLIRQYRIDGHPYLLALTSAYLFGACLALPVALTFPDAFGSGRVFGHDTSSAILFLSWRVGSAVLLLLAVLLGIMDRHATEKRARGGALLAVLFGTALVAAAFIAAALNWHMQPLTEGRFNLSSIVAGWLVVGLSLVGVILIFTTRSHDRPMFGWLALMLTATVADMTLSTFSGGRHSLGWYVSRCSTVIASYLLLAYLAAEFARGLKDRPEAARRFSYVGAVALALCAVMLRYFLSPWVGTGLVYTTLYGAVAVAVWMNGWRPATVTATLGLILALLFVKAPFGEIAFNGAADAIGIVLYALSCVLIIALGHRMRAARLRFEKSQEAAIQGYSMLRALRDENGKIFDFVIEYVNPRGAALAKLTPEAAQGRRLTELLPGVVSAGVFSSFINVTETGEPLETEVRYEQDGVVGWFRNMVIKLDDGVAISFFDITHAKRLERELAQRAQLLERADTNKRRFLATLSHELRNPLAPLRNGLAILKRRSGGENGDVLTMMDRQLTQLVRLVDDLLDVSRIDRGKIELRRERVTVDSVVSSAIETARPSIDAREHELVVGVAQK